MELEELEKIAKRLEKENDKKAAADPIVRVSLTIVRDFIKDNEVMCYGGTAINNLLPPEDRFYNPTYDIPDYDFFSKEPQEHAMKLADKLAKAGIKDVEVKPGQHLGTFKVFSDFEGVADITHLDKPIFEKLWKENVTRDGIHYVTPNFLRMSVYLELSRPQGDVSRWAKVYERLLLLNKHYPMECPGAPDEPTEMDKADQKWVEKILKKEPVVLLGITATQIHEKKGKKLHWYAPVTVLADVETIEKIAEGKEYRKTPGTDILPQYVDIANDEGKIILRMHETVACHSYHAMANGIHVASIPTLLQYFLAYLYAGATEGDLTHILCVAQRLVDLAHSKEKRRYALLTPSNCLGTQETLTEIRKTKAVLYERLSKNKGSVDFLKFFFTYNPRDTATRRKRAKDNLRKTRKARIESSY
jgi:hypothetical protein